MEWDLEHEHRLTETEDRSKSNTHRLDKLEKETEAINALATSVQVMATKQDQVIQSVDKLDGNVTKLDGKVTALEIKPAKRWDSIVDKLIWAVVGAFVAFALGQIGIT